MSDQAKALVDEFAAAAVGYGAAMTVGDPKSAKAQLVRCSDAYRTLRKHGRFAQDLLLTLLASDDLAIRYMAAVHALDFAPTEGERTLEEILRGAPSPVRLLAHTSLLQWKSGLVQF